MATQDPQPEISDSANEGHPDPAQDDASTSADPPGPDTAAEPADDGEPVDLDPTGPANLDVLFADAASGDKVAAALAEALASDFGILEVERGAQLGGLNTDNTHTVLAERIAQAERDIGAGAGGDRDAWIRGMKELSGFVPTAADMANFDKSGGPNVLALERQFELLGIDTRPQPYLDRIEALRRDLDAARSGDGGALGRLAAAFGGDPLEAVKSLGLGGPGFDFLDQKLSGIATHPAGASVGIPGGTGSAPVRPSSGGDAGRPDAGAGRGTDGFDASHAFPKDDGGDDDSADAQPADPAPGDTTPSGPAPTPPAAPAPAPAEQKPEGEKGEEGKDVGIGSGDGTGTEKPRRQIFVTTGEMDVESGSLESKGKTEDTAQFPDGSVLHIEHGSGKQTWDDSKKKELVDDDPAGFSGGSIVRPSDGISAAAEQRLIRAEGDRVSPDIELAAPPGAERGTATLDRTTGDVEGAATITRAPAPRDPVDRDVAPGVLPGGGNPLDPSPFERDDEP